MLLLDKLVTRTLLIKQLSGLCVGHKFFKFFVRWECYGFPLLPLQFPYLSLGKNLHSGNVILVKLHIFSCLKQ